MTVALQIEAPSPAPFKLHRRFDRTGRLLGDSGMERLANARVIVFGLGGVGSYAVEGLVRSGIGHLTLVDFDVVCVTNINRQLHATVSTVGKSKAELLAQRCKQINPDVSVEFVKEFYRAEVSDQMLEGHWDYVVDAIDNVKAKLHLLNECVQRGIKVVSSMGAAGRPGVRKLMPGFTVLSLPLVRRMEAALPFAELADAGFFFPTAATFFSTVLALALGAGFVVREADLAGFAALGAGFFAAGLLFAGAVFLGAAFLRADFGAAALAGFFAALTGFDFALLGIAGGRWSRGDRRWSSG